MLVASTALVGLIAVTPAGSRPAAGITITPREPVTAIIGAPDATGLYMYGVVVAARFSPDVLHDDARVTFTSTRPGGSGYPPFTGRDAGNVMHSTAVYQSFFATVEGERLMITAKWNAWTPQPSGNISGSKTSSPHFVTVPKREPAPRVTPDRKQRLAALSTKYYALCAASAIGGTATIGLPPVGIALFAVGGLFCGAGAAMHALALDPIDPNYRIVAKPKMPPAPRVAAGEGVSRAAASALNELLALQAKEIGLAAAILTAFNRSQGAHVKKQTVWEKRQMQASGKYAAQLSALMLSEAKLRTRVKSELSASVEGRDLDTEVSEDDAYAFQLSLATGSLPARLAAGLKKLGLTSVELKEVRSQLIVRNHPTLYAGDAIAAIAGPSDLAQLRQVAADLKSFSRQAAKNPLNTGS